MVLLICRGKKVKEKKGRESVSFFLFPLDLSNKKNEKRQHLTQASASASPASA